MDSADGTYLAFGPDANWPKLMRWLDRVNGLEANPVYVEARERHESATRMRVALVAAPDSDYEQISLEHVS